jgi:hypothetical protein
MPDAPQVSPAPNAGFVPYVLIEEVDYSLTLPWPTNAFETGNSLQRLGSAAFGNDPAHWQGALPTPAALNVDAAQYDSDFDSYADEDEFVAGTDATDPEDYLRFDQASLAAGLVQLRFLAHSGRT